MNANHPKKLKNTTTKQLNMKIMEQLFECLFFSQIAKSWPINLSRTNLMQVVQKETMQKF